MEAIKAKNRISVLGDGGWGTTLAIHLHNKGYDVTLWGVFDDYVASLKKKRVNTRFLPGITIPRGLNITSDLREAGEGKDLIVLAIPSQYMRGVLQKAKPHIDRRNSVLVSVTKGIENKTLMRMSQVISDELGTVKLGVLSGPTIAHELAKGMPTTAVVACGNPGICRYLQRIFISDRFRIYANDDVVGVELGGSLKNVIAIGCGISDGLGFGSNAKAALLSRGLVEISRLGVALGAKTRTFSGISGLGDLVTTCISAYSRNRYIGEQIGRGKKLKQVVKHMQMIAEGVPTARSAYELGKRHKVEMPIVREVYSVLYKNKNALKAVKDLMTRKMKVE
ncbi:MAG: NAD(P)-dependent glycerol-3-phosphate dehydrogenase [Candidatus Omnitrophica bacterium]|nr:NAD(P)-dependent glycerol-3-phosphate dehydrogenase [Candidatus Omnitrophota bacterium]MDD5654179.1 NAD(P)-dependent glycerol-3-phosphate dehydrogenase [Candidatus Omnitrophota bacterium]